MNPQQVAVSVVTKEIDALVSLKERLTQGLAQKIEYATVAIKACEGNVIVTGVGKSGLVAQKAVSTFRTLGTPAVFLDPVAAAHGELGQIRDGDVVIVLSWSGRSDELTPIVEKVAMNDQVRLISIGRDPTSHIAQLSNLFLELPGVEEACMLGLTPTASATMMVAIMDALAVAAGEMVRFDRVSFIENHPAGTLGRGK